MLIQRFILRSLLFPPKAAHPSTFAIFQKLVLGSGQQLAHCFQVSYTHFENVDAEKTHPEGLRIGVSCLFKAILRRNRILASFLWPVFQLFKNVVFFAVARWTKKGESCRQIDEELIDFAQFCPLAARLFLR